MTESSTLEAQHAALARAVLAARATGRDARPIAGTAHLLEARLALLARDAARAATAFEASAAEYRAAELHRESAEAAMEGARALRGAGQGARALDLAEAALASAQRLWRAADAGDRFEVPELHVRAAELAVTLAFEHASNERWYAVLEGAKEAWLGEVLAVAEGPLDPALLDLALPTADPDGHRWRLDHAIATLDSAWSYHYSSATVDARPEAEAALARAYAAVEDPRRALRPTAPRETTLAELQAALADGEAVLEFFAAHGALYATLVTRRGLERARVPLPLAALRERALGAYVVITETPGRRALAKKLTGAGQGDLRRTLGTMARILYPAPPDFPRRAHEALLLPFAAMLGEVRRLVVAPHGPLHLVPFHVLEDERGAPLARGVSLSYAPSAAAWLRRRRPRPTAAHPAGPAVTLLAVERRFTPRRAEAVARALGAEPLELPRSALEEDMEALGHSLGVVPTLGVRADKHAVLGALARGGEVHLACAGAQARASRAADGLVLADGVLSLAELLASERLRGATLELVVLDLGASTAAQPRASERATALGYALAARLGAPVILQLWPTTPEARTRLLTRLRERRQAGEGLAEALRGAQQDLREAGDAVGREGLARPFAEPFYWAGYFLLEA